MDFIEDADIIYGTSTVRRYLKKFHGVEISMGELNQRLTEVIFEEIKEEGYEDDGATGRTWEDFDRYC